MEKAVDGFVGTYGEGLANNIIKKSAKDETRHEALERLLGISGETMGAFFSSILNPLIESSYNDKTIKESYTPDVWSDALRNAAISGVLSGTKSVWADAKNMAAASTADAIDRAAEADNIRQWQKAMKQSYIGSAQQDAESYASLIRMLLNRKGDGRRW